MQNNNCLTCKHAYVDNILYENEMCINYAHKNNICDSWEEKMLIAYKFTPKQQEIINFLAYNRNTTYLQIANAFYVKIDTARQYIKQLAQELHISGDRLIAQVYDRIIEEELTDD